MTPVVPVDTRRSRRLLPICFSPPRLLYFISMRKYLPLAITLILFCGVHVLLRKIPDEIFLRVFCVVPARLAAGYYGAALQTPELIFSARGTTLAVTRECAATGFFTMAAAMLAWACLAVKGTWQWALVLPLAWCATMLANAARLILLIPATAWMRALLPEKAHALGHQGVGTLVFLSCLILLWFAAGLLTRPAKCSRSAS